MDKVVINANENFINFGCSFRWNAYSMSLAGSQATIAIAWRLAH